MNRRRIFLSVLVLSLAAVPFFAFAQEQRGGDRGNFDPARFREEMMNRFKEDLGAKDDEWTVLQPKLEKVMNAQRDSMMSRFGGFGGRGRGSDRGDRGGDRGGDQNASPVTQASRELRDALENKETPNDQIVAKLKALRDARAKVKADLEAAQKDLQSVVTPRQEAVLVSRGMLD
jgi:hypothetical protein